MLLINATHPSLRIYDPETREYVAFNHGRLSIDKGDPGYEVAMAEARRNPLISIFNDEGERVKAAAKYACDICSLPFGTQDELVSHMLAMHASRPVIAESGEVLDPGESRARGKRNKRTDEVPPAEARG